MLTNELLGTHAIIVATGNARQQKAEKANARPVAKPRNYATIIALGARTVREAGDLWRRARLADKHLATLAIDTEIRFASPADRAAFTRELSQAVAELASRYHNQAAPGGRSHRLLVVAYPLPKLINGKEA